MAYNIANGIFKQLLMAEETELGVLSTDSGQTSAGTLQAIAANGVKGGDEVSCSTVGGDGVLIGGKILKGTKVNFSNDPTVNYFVTEDVTATSAFTLKLDTGLKTAVTAGTTTYSFNYTAGERYIPKMLRRVSSNIDLKKATYQSNEIKTDAQLSDMRHGGISVEGTISGELSGYTYQAIIGALLRRDFTSSATRTLGTNATVATATVAGVDTGLAAKITLATGDFSSNGEQFIKTGEVFWFKTGSANNLIPLLVIDSDVANKALTVVPLHKPSTWTNWSAGTISSGSAYEVLGKKTYIPKTGHTKKSFTFEHFYKDVSPQTHVLGEVPSAELFAGCRPTQMSVRLPATGLATVDFTMMGVRMKTPADYTTTSWYGDQSILQNLLDDAPLDSGIDPIYSAAVGAIYMKPSPTDAVEKVGLITAFDFTVNGNGNKADVVGSNETPDIFLGKLSVQGNLSIYFVDNKWRDVFYKEKEASMIAVFTSNSLGDASTKFMSFVMPRIKTGGASKDDGDKALVMTVPFTALLGDGSNGFEATTLEIQDFS